MGLDSSHTAEKGKDELHAGGSLGTIDVNITRGYVDEKGKIGPFG
jgi:hypothetical protein